MSMLGDMLADVPAPFPLPIGLRLSQAARAVERALDEALGGAGRRVRALAAGSLMRAWIGCGNVASGPAGAVSRALLPGWRRGLMPLVAGARCGRVQRSLTECLVRGAASRAARGAGRLAVLSGRPIARMTTGERVSPGPSSARTAALSKPPIWWTASPSACAWVTSAATAARCHIAPTVAACRRRRRCGPRRGPVRWPPRPRPGCREPGPRRAGRGPGRRGG